MDENTPDRASELPDDFDIFARDDEAADGVDDALISGLTDDARLGSGVPGEQRLSESDFIAMSGVTQPRPKPAAKPTPKSADADNEDSGQFVSFAEPGVADVEETDETEPLARGAVPIAEPEPLTPELLDAEMPEEPVIHDEVEVEPMPEVVEAEVEVDASYVSLDAEAGDTATIDFASPAEDFSALIEEMPDPDQEAQDIAQPLEEPEPVLRTAPPVLPVRTRLEEAEQLLNLLSSQPRESLVEEAEFAPHTPAEPEVERVETALHDADADVEKEFEEPSSTPLEDEQAFIEPASVLPEPEVTVEAEIIAATSAPDIASVSEPEPEPEPERIWSPPAQEDLYDAEPPLPVESRATSYDDAPLARPIASEEPSLLGAPFTQSYGQRDSRQSRMANEHESPPSRQHVTRYARRRKRMLMRVAIVLSLVALGVMGYVAYHELVRPRILTPDELYARATVNLARHEYLDASNRFAEFARRAPDHPNRPEAQFNAALALHMNAQQNVELRQSQVGQAAALLEDFIRDNPSHKKLPRARSLLGILYYETGRHDEAIEMLRELVRQLDDQLAALPVLRTLARAYGKSGALDEAENIYLQAASMQKNYTPDVDYFELGELYQRRAELEEAMPLRQELQSKAVQYFTLAQETSVVDPETRDAIGEAVAALNRRAEAELPVPEDPTPASAVPMVEVPAVESSPVASGQDVNPMLEAQQLGQPTVVQP